MEGGVVEYAVSSATVELAAKAAGVIPARIAKSLTFHGDGHCDMVVAAGDARVNNGKYKLAFGRKPAMLPPDMVQELTGHEVGGVCPFALPATTVVHLDISLRRFSTVFPACGSGNSAVEMDLEQLWEASGAVGWVDVCTGWQEEEREK
ncbi:MAG: YbaK/EbsC family protein [Clostridiales bacterium]|nr:YbaK/EbsC family protein [Clostridiales bacterium]